ALDLAKRREFRLGHGSVVYPGWTPRTGVISGKLLPMHHTGGPTSVVVSQADIDALASHAAQELKDYITNVPEANNQWLGLVTDIAADAASGVLPKEAVNDSVYSASRALFDAITNYGSASGDPSAGN